MKNAATESLAAMDDVLATSTRNRRMYASLTDGAIRWSAVLGNGTYDVNGRLDRESKDASNLEALLFFAGTVDDVDALALVQPGPFWRGAGIDRRATGNLKPLLPLRDRRRHQDDGPRSCRPDAPLLWTTRLPCQLRH